jgi:chaperonin GroEL
MRGTLKVAAVKAPDFGDRRKLILEDIAVLTGGTIFDKDKGMKLDKFDWKWFGEAKTATITKESTTIIDGAVTEESILQRAEDLATQLENAETPFEMEKLQERLAKFSGGVAVVHVGGSTETEMKETKDRVDDALHATKAALEGGIVPGGGIALLYSRKALDEALTGDLSESTRFGYKLVYDACAKPFHQILSNAGYSEANASMIAMVDLKGGADFWTGYNIKECSIVNMKDAGIIDPFKVTKQALQNAASIAGTILLTEVISVNIPGEDNAQPQGMDPSMMGMM